MEPSFGVRRKTHPTSSFDELGFRLARNIGQGPGR